MASIAESLKKFDLFTNFEDQHLNSIASIVTHRQLDDSDFIFQEGDMGNEILFIVKGQVQIQKKSIDNTVDEDIKLLGEGEILGELSFLDGSTRSATAKAIDDTELLLLKRADLKSVSGNSTLEKELSYQIALTISKKLRNETESIIVSFQKERESHQRQYEFGQFFIYVLVCYAIGMLINHTLYTYFPDLNLYSDAFTWSYLIVLMVPGIFLVWVLRIPWARVGVTTIDWKLSCKEGVIAGAVALGLIVVGVLVCQTVGIIDSRPFQFDIIAKPHYFLHTYGQEFLARGLLQNSLRRFFNDQKGYRAVLLSSILFALLHMHFGLVAVFLTFVSSILLGVFYLRHQSLLGVSILHWSIGVAAFMTGLL